MSVRRALSSRFVLASILCVLAIPAFAQRASLSNSSRSFGSVAVGTTSAAKTVTVSNSASTALMVGSIVASGDFAQTNTCGSLVAGRGSCVISITFTPTAAGSRTGTVTITDNASNSPQKISLTGTGVAPASMTPASRSYSTTNVGSTSASKSFTLTNNQSSTLPVQSIASSGDFIQSNNCGVQLAANKSCTINVSFKPTANGSRTGSVTATVGATSIVLTGTLSGTGAGAPAVPVTVLPATLTFAAQAMGTSSAAQSITVHNAQASTLTITGINVTGDFAQSGTTCGATLSANGNCTIGINFTPTATGTRAGAVTITHDATNSPQTVNLSGQGSAALVSITVSPSLPMISKGATQQFTATGSYADSTQKDITALVSWGTSDSTVLGINPQGKATAVAAGVATISASMGSITGSSNATVTTPTMTGILVSPPTASVPAGSTQQFNAAASLSDGTTTDVTASASWNSSDTSVATVVAGKVTALKQGTVTIEASYAAKISDATLTVLASGACSSTTIDMKVLVVSSGKSEADYPAITQILDYVGTPYTVLDFKAQPTGVTAAMVSDGACHGFYQGVIFANGGYINSLPGMATLTAYEQKFGIRQLNWFASPGVDFGLNTTNKTIATTATYTASFTPAAASIFPYLNTATPLTVANATVYLAVPLGVATPLLTDASGNAISVIYDKGDGRQYLTQTFDSNQYLLHDLRLAYGLLNWVTKGLFLGEYHVYAAPQVDDVFISDAEWVAGTKCGTDADSASLPNYRIKASDVDALVAWQNSKQSNPLLSNFVLSLAFNGVGTTGDRDYTGLPANAVDDLTPELQKYQASFNWISHTWDHPDSLNGMSQSAIDAEVNPNNAEALALGLTNFVAGNMVTPGVSGLNDTKTPGELVKDGIRTVVSDTSVVGQINNGTNPSPNVGIVNSYATQLYEVPRHANNMFYNVNSPADWVAEYHCIYAGQAPYSTYTYQQIQDYISASFVIDMLKGDMDPEMFHQPNLHAYDGTHSILGDLYDETFNTYFSLYNLPVLSPALDVLGQNMKNRDAYNRSGVTGSIISGPTSQITISIPAGSAIPTATIPVTGLNSTGAEVYGGQNISHLPVNKGQTIVVPLP